MCGRYDLDATVEELTERFSVPLRELSVSVAPLASAGAKGAASAAWKPRYNIAPRQHNPVLMSDGNRQNRLQMMQWGLVPA
jgi:putative SOS response-associated peptidase YedK